MIWFVAPVLLVKSIIPSNMVAGLEFADRIWIKYILPILIVELPVVLLIMGRIRRTQVILRDGELWLYKTRLPAWPGSRVVLIDRIVDEVWK